MATVTGLTAARMLEIEAASVVDGDVIGDNLILTKHDGSTINAGSVRGPKGDQGATGPSDISVFASIPVLDVGIPNQIRAGRQLTVADFTSMALSAPIGLWNLNDLTDASGAARTLTNKGGVTFSPGINGTANTAAQFNGNLAQGLYVPDAGGSDPFRFRWNASWGCWFRTGKRGNTIQGLMCKRGVASGGLGWDMYVYGNQVYAWVSTDGTATAANVGSITDVADDRWHFVVIVFDPTVMKMYIDGVLESQAPSNTLIFPSPGPMSIGAEPGDNTFAGNALSSHYGRIDEAFITLDALSDDQIRMLYAMKIPHGFSGTPKRVTVGVRRRRKGGALLAGDFPTQPLRLHNFSGGSAGDEGSNAVGLTNNGAQMTAGADGSYGNGMSFFTAAGYNLSSTDAGLPTGVATRSFGCWFKTTVMNGGGLIGWGNGAAQAAQCLFVPGGGILTARAQAADDISGNFVADGNWHFAVVVEANAPSDGIKRRLYVDGRCVGNSINQGTIALGGANRFRVGAWPDASLPFSGQIDCAFVCDYALNTQQILTLYAKGSQALGLSPKGSYEHVEGVDATNVYAIFDNLDSQHQVDMAVA